MKRSHLFKRTAAAISAAVMLSALPSGSAGAAVIDPENPNNYDNFAEALQLALCFYDANKCGDKVGEDGYYTWREDCHVKDAEIPLQPMNPMPTVNKSKSEKEKEAEKEKEKEKEKEGEGLGAYDGKGDGGASAAAGLFEGVNMSQEFIDANKKYLDPDGNGTLDLTGGWHDAGDHVKFGLPGSYSASTLGWGYYEFRDAYKETGLDEHVEDELRWINDYFMKATFLDDDDHVVAYCYQVGEGQNDHNYWCAPELQVDGTVVASSSCAVKRPAYFATTEMPASDQCAGAAASLAINYLNFKDTDPKYAAENLKYAKALYDFAVETHTEEMDPNSTTPLATSLGYDGGFYTSSYDYDELAWAAVWLYYCTENYDYIDDIIAVDYDHPIKNTQEGNPDAKDAYPYKGYMKRIISDTGRCWQNIWVHCWDTVWGGVFAKLAPVTNTARDWYIFNWNLEFWSGVSPELAAEVAKGGTVEVKDKDGNVISEVERRQYYTGVTGHKYFGKDDELWNIPMTADKLADLPEKPGDTIAKSPNGWAVVSGYGSARYNTAAGLEAMVFAKETGDMRYVEWAKDQMEYILGDNPMGYSYEVGYGSNYASQPHHRASHCSATQSMENPIVEVHTLWGALTGGPDLNDFHRDRTDDYIYNEVTDDYNAAFCGDLAGLYHYYGSKGKELEKKNYVRPDFNMSENAAGYDQVDKNGDPLPVGLYISGGKNQEKEDGLQIKIVLHNRTINPPRFESDLKARYYFNIDELTAIGEDATFVETRTDYDQEKSFTDGKNQATISEPIKYDDKGTYYVEISWQNCDFYGSRVYQFALLNKMDPVNYTTTWDSTNDYSYADLVSFENDNDAAAITDKITLYADGKLVWGVEPDGTAAEDATGSAEPAATLWGDADCSGSVTVSDIVTILQYSANKKKYPIKALGLKNADVNADGDVNSKDAYIVQQLDAGILKQKDMPYKK